ncbi:hypothetical protein HPB49_007403 [Dermacentor silvarum]|uniref:Uncharacterized protein n=1 Tax=Dermacentor silvarum TaxID=543639 RepID=A0ACB8CDT0_DERSI|nr:hypothetical protein HPB49_007403 [Dermacentor silvarum]
MPMSYSPLEWVLLFGERRIALLASRSRSLLWLTARTTLVAFLASLLSRVPSTSTTLLRVTLRSSSKNVGKVSGTNFAVTKVHKNAQKSGAGADDIEDSLPDNVYSDQLRFLKDTVEGRATSGNLDDGKSAQELFHTMTRPRSITPPISPVQESADIEDLFTLEDDVDMSQPSTSSRQSTTSETAGQDPPSQQPQAQSQTNEQRSRKRKQDPLQREIDEVSQRLAKHKPLDEDEYLAFFLVPTMKELPKHKKLRMRIEVQEILESLKQAC